MAKDLRRLMNAREHMVLNPNTTGSAEHVSEFMEQSGWTGEIFVQLKDGDASLWTLAQDNITAIEFISKNQIEDLTDLQISAITPSEANVKEEYALVDSDGDVKGETIKIYNDSSLFSVYIGHVDDALEAGTNPPVVIPGTGDTALCFIYVLVSGEYTLTAIDIEEFLEESEFADGLQVNEHVVSVKIDPTSEPVVTEYDGTSAATVEDVITVGPDGIRIAHIQEAIDAALGQVNGFSEITDGTDTIEADEPGTVLTVNGSDTVAIAIDEEHKSMTFTSPEINASGDSYVSVDADNHNITIETNIVDTVEEFENEDVDGKLADAGVLKKIIVDDERVVSEALNDLNDRLNKIATPQDILESEDYGEGFADAFDVKNFSVYDVDTTDSATTSGVRTVFVGGLKKMDFSHLSIDCGTF